MGAFRHELVENPASGAQPGADRLPCSGHALLRDRQVGLRAGAR